MREGNALVTLNMLPGEMVHGVKKVSVDVVSHWKTYSIFCTPLYTVGGGMYSPCGCV